jgi:hypothetical protein
MNFTMVPVHAIVAMIDDPFRIWATSQPVTRQMVMNAIADGTYNQERTSYSHGSWSGVWGALRHARRIAWLVVNRWEDPIELDVGIPSVGYYPYIVIDGHHRLCAAIISGDTEIRAQVSGSIDYAFDLFGVDVTLTH